jgi:hypothetical protein
MRQVGRTIIWVAIAVGLAACARSEPTRTAGGAPLDEALQRDLALASGEGVALAGAARTYEPTRFVSAIEGGPAAAPRSPRATPRPQPRRRPAPIPRPTPQAEDVAEVALAEAEEVAPVATVEAGTSDVVEEAAPAPAPAAEPTRAEPAPAPAAGGGGGGRRGGGVGVGTVIGVIGAVLRGGSVSGGVDDDCELHHPRRRPSAGDPRVFGGPRIGGTFGGAIATGRVNDRLPARGPGIGQGTFPRY